MTNNQPFTIFLIQSAHTDIGYTHPQEQIARMYLDYYDKVLELCRKTANDPLPQRFKWVCETSWQVREYLSQRPERTDEFIYFVRTGQIEITAAYLHFTDLIDKDAYRRSLDWVSAFCKQHDLPLRTAMHCDINGWTWALPALLQERGIGFFLSQLHLDSATDPLGKPGTVHQHWKIDPGMGALMQPNTPTRTPQAFWWQAPNGQRVLQWYGEHYHLGNFLGLSGIFQFSALKTRYFWEADRDPVEKLYTVALKEVPRYIEQLQAQGYSYNSTLVSLSGYLVDNSAPDARWCEIVARWNAEHEDIKLRTATVSEWYDHLLTLDNGTWPTYQMAWPDHWAHGLGSMTARIGQARGTQRRRSDAITLAQQAAQPEIDALLDAGLEQERLAMEHTFNAWMTTAMPYHPQNEFLAHHKELTFQRTELYFDDVIAMTLRKLAVASGDGQKLYVRRADDAPELRTVHFGAGDAALDDTAQALVADDGQVYLFQRDSHPLDRPRYVAALSMPAQTLHGLAVRARSIQPARTSSQSTLENDYWKLQVDPRTGALTSLCEVTTRREWVDPNAHYGFGQLIHETVIHPLGRPAISNQARLVADGVASEALQQQMGDYGVFDRIAPIIEDSPPQFKEGAVFDAITLKGALVDKDASLGGVEITWRSYHALPLIELVIDWDKQWHELPEAAYVAFPFQIAGDCLNLETAGGFFQPGSHTAGGQLPGTASSYYTIQRAAHLQSPEGDGLLWLPLEAPLVMLQDINFNNWDRRPFDWNGFLASMPVNHYWHTNFARSQRGYLRLRYRFLSLNGFTDREQAIQTALPVEALGWR